MEQRRSTSGIKASAAMGAEAAGAGTPNSTGSTSMSRHGSW
jgi:hypothetical protein